MSITDLLKSCLERVSYCGRNRGHSSAQLWFLTVSIIYPFSGLTKCQCISCHCHFSISSTRFWGVFLLLAAVSVYLRCNCILLLGEIHDFENFWVERAWGKVTCFKEFIWNSGSPWHGVFTNLSQLSQQETGLLCMLLWIVHPIFFTLIFFID